MGPCVGKQSQEDYQKNIQQAREILKGNTRQVLRSLKEEMERKHPSGAAKPEGRDVETERRTAF